MLVVGETPVAADAAAFQEPFHDPRPDVVPRGQFRQRGVFLHVGVAYVVQVGIKRVRRPGPRPGIPDGGHPGGFQGLADRRGAPPELPGGSTHRAELLVEADGLGDRERAGRVESELLLNPGSNPGWPVVLTVDLGAAQPAAVGVPDFRLPVSGAGPVDALAREFRRAAAGDRSRAPAETGGDRLDLLPRLD